MSFFSLLFYALLVLSIPILALIVRFQIRGRRHSSRVTLLVYLVLVAVYMTGLLATTLAMPIRVIGEYEAQYSGDWSIAVAAVQHHPHDMNETWEIDFRMGNRGKETIGGEKGLAVYLLSENGTRYNQTAEPATPAFDVPVKPGEWITTTREFVLPANQNRVELVIAQQGIRASWFIIGRSPFDGRTVIHLQ